MSSGLGFSPQDHALIVGLAFLGVFLGVCIFLSRLGKYPLAAIFAVLGYVGAALYYGYLLGFDSQTQLSCPLCPQISGSGQAMTKFAFRTSIFGTVNAICLTAAGWLIVGVIRRVAKRMTGSAP